MLLRKLDSRYFCLDPGLKLIVSFLSNVSVGVVIIDWVTFNLDLEWVLDPPLDQSDKSSEVNVDLVKSLTNKSSLLEELEAELVGNFSICLRVLKHFLDT